MLSRWPLDLFLLVITILFKLMASVSFVNCLVARHNVRWIFATLEVIERCQSRESNVFSCGSKICNDVIHCAAARRIQHINCLVAKEWYLSTTYLEYLLKSGNSGNEVRTLRVPALDTASTLTKTVDRFSPITRCWAILLLNSYYLQMLPKRQFSKLEYGEYRPTNTQPRLVMCMISKWVLEYRKYRTIYQKD